MDEKKSSLGITKQEAFEIADEMRKARNKEERDRLIKSVRGEPEPKVDSAPKWDKATETPPEPLKCRVSVEGTIVTVDGKPYALVGTAKVTERMSEYFRDLVEADGEFVKRPENIKTREIEKQPDEIKKLIDAQPGAGSRIPREKLWLN